MQQWVESGQSWAGNERPFLLLDIQMLGQAEGPLLGFEGVLSELLSKDRWNSDYSTFMTQCAALSTYWIFGLYEVIRKIRDTRSSENFVQLAPLFADIEILRMPLAKHQVKGAPGYREVPHYPTPIIGTEFQRLGWSVFDPRKGTEINLFRRDLADRFLSEFNSH